MNQPETFYAYHVVTERPMAVGQVICFDETHHSGVWQRVMEKAALVQDIYAHPQQYDGNRLEHHTAVALRELALEEVRKTDYPQFPSRLACLYVSDTPEEARQWENYFIHLRRPVFGIVKLKITGHRFAADANNCFTPSLYREENLRLAHRYWLNLPNLQQEPPIREILADGVITVIGKLADFTDNSL